MKRYAPEFRRTKAEWNRLSKINKQKNSLYIKTVPALCILITLIMIFTLPFFMGR